jgi:hypothetical protein
MTVSARIALHPARSIRNSHAIGYAYRQRRREKSFVRKIQLHISPERRSARERAVISIEQF